MMSLKNYVLSLAMSGKSFFTENNALKETGLSRIALRSALRRLKKKQEIASPLRGFFIIVPRNIVLFDPFLPNNLLMI